MNHVILGYRRKHIRVVGMQNIKQFKSKNVRSTVEYCDSINTYEWGIFSVAKFIYFVAYIFFIVKSIKVFLKNRGNNLEEV